MARKTVRVTLRCRNCGRLYPIKPWLFLRAAGYCSRKCGAAQRLYSMDHFWASVEPEPNSGCWLWMRARWKGYGKLMVGGRSMLARRFSFAVVFGRELPPDIVLDHKCQNKACVNPGHLEPVTSPENTRRTAKAMCEQGHPWDRYNGGRPRCSVCELARLHRWREKRRMAAA